MKESTLIQIPEVNKHQWTVTYVLWFFHQWNPKFCICWMWASISFVRRCGGQRWRWSEEQLQHISRRSQRKKKKKKKRTQREVMGVVRLRLARFGRKNLPFYRIFVADSRAPRDGKHIEVVGHYNPLPGTCLSVCSFIFSLPSHPLNLPFQEFSFHIL